MVYPRTGGGNHSAAITHQSWDGLSPHGRGKPVIAVGGGDKHRSIPARAGETDGITLDWRMHKVYPRTGGGNLPIALPRLSDTGLSPHGRGKRAVPRCFEP